MSMREKKFRKNSRKFLTISIGQVYLTERPLSILLLISDKRKISTKKKSDFLKSLAPVFRKNSIKHRSKV